MTIIIPVIDAILGKDIITGETLNDFERGMKAAGAAIDLFTLGQAMVLAGGVEAGAGIIVKTLAVEMVSNAAGYSAGYAANEMGMPLPVTWILSVATGCTVSATVGGYLFTSADGTITKCTAEEAGDLIKRLDKTDSPTSFADMMSPEDAARYLRFLENGSTEGLTSAELEGIKKVDELLALKKISYQDVLDIRNSGKALESGSNADIKPYTNSRPSFRKGVVEEVWENAKGPDGLVRDPNTGEVINWTPGESRKGVWDMGHIPEAKYSEMHEAYMNGELTTKEFVDWYNDPANYRPELPSNNRSHKYE